MNRATLAQISTDAHRLSFALATSVQCSCGWIISNPDLDDLRVHCAT